MESIFPIFVVCIAPMVWTGLVFLAGRWSASHTISIQRRANGQPTANSPYYTHQEETY